MGRSATSRGEVFRELFAGSKTKRLATKAEISLAASIPSKSETVNTFSAWRKQIESWLLRDFSVGQSRNCMLSNCIVNTEISSAVAAVVHSLAPLTQFWYIHGVSHGVHPDRKMLFQSNSQEKTNNMLEKDLYQEIYEFMVTKTYICPLSGLLQFCNSS